MCTRTEREQDILLEKGSPIPLKYEGIAVSGDVTIKNREFWLEKVSRDKLACREDLVELFRELTPSDVIQAWRNIILVEKTITEEIPPKEFTGEYYDVNYFKTRKGKKFTCPNGSVEHWGYRNPNGELLSARPITQAWKIIFNPENMLAVASTIFFSSHDSGE